MTLPDDIRLPIIAGWYSPALHRLIRQQISDAEAKVRLLAIVGPDADEALALAGRRLEAHPGRRTRAQVLNELTNEIACGERPWEHE